MVNPGHASKGCGTCRLRRIKCDEGHPSCVRCAKSNRICLGYSNQKRGHVPDLSKSKNRVQHQLAPRSSLQQRHNPVDRMTQTHAQLLNDFIVATRVGEFVPAAFYLPGVAPAEQGIAHAVHYVLQVLNQGFQSLEDHSQTLSTRKKRQEEYAMAIKALRQSILAQPASKLLLTPVYLFALYEMTVNLETEDGTWNIHLDGLLATFRQLNAPSIFSIEERVFSLTRAMHILNSPEKPTVSLLASELRSGEKVWLLLDVAKLQLRKLLSEIEETFAHNSPPRKIDMQKIRSIVQRIRKDLAMFPLMTPDVAQPTSPHDTVPTSHTKTDVACSGSAARFDVFPREKYVDLSIAAMWNEYRTLLIITSSLLLRTNEVLLPNGTNRYAKESPVLLRTIQEAALQIRASVASYFQDGVQYSTSTESLPEVGSTTRVNALQLLWPLYCASTAPGVPVPQREWTRKILWLIGEQAHIPKAFDLAMADMGTSNYRDVVDGLLLTDIAIERDKTWQ